MTPNTGPLISVVIPSYNHGRYLGRALQSVLDQTYTHWEAFVIDNHSTDDTDKLLSRFVDPRITVLKIHNNGVIAASRNMGIRAANGEWVAFLDSDDWWTADKLQVCLSKINAEVDVVYHRLKIVADKPRLFGSRSIKSWQVKTPVVIDLLTRGNAIATSSAMVRTTLLRQLNGMNESPEIAAAEDYNTWLRIAEIGSGFRYVPKQLGFYQLHSQGTSSSKDMSVPARNAVKEFVHFLSVAQRERLEANLRYTSARYYYLTGYHVCAKADLLFSLRYSKLNLRIKLLWMIVSVEISHQLKSIRIK